MSPSEQGAARADAAIGQSGPAAPGPVVPIDRQLYVKLIDTLYGTPKSIVAASITAVVIIAVAWRISGDAVFGLTMAGFAIVGIYRAAICWTYRRRRPLERSADRAEFWERLALVGATLFAGLCGSAGAYTIFHYANTPVEILIICGVMGYVAGISSRNAGRPTITVSQISATCIPLLLAMTGTFDVVHLTLAVFIGALYVSTISMARSMHENVVARHKAHQELETAAMSDALTGVGSRMAFTRQLERQLRPGAGDAVSTCLLAIDLDNFKDVNDTLGHPVGDAVLKETTRRIEETVPFEHAVARIGGDEFLVSFQDREPAEIEAVARAIVRVLTEPFYVGDIKVSCGASVGIAMAPRDATTLEEIMQCADLALYSAKSNGRGQVAVFSPAMAKSHLNRIDLERRMLPGIQNDEFSLVYQPIVDPKTGRAKSFEALLRWQNPVRGAVSPAEFIPIAESTGLIIPLGEWVLRTACREAASWPNDATVSVNLSLIQFRAEQDLVKIVTAALEESGLPPHRLDLEITESVVTDDTERTLRIVEEFRAMNIGVSMDDFGTGFSSFAYLHDFPFSQIKFDRKFSQEIARSPRAKAIIEAVTRLCQTLGMRVVAEGVETPQQLLMLHSLQVDSIQGFIYSRPVPPAELADMFDRPLQLTVPDHDTGVPPARNRA